MFNKIYSNSYVTHLLQTRLGSVGEWCGEHISAAAASSWRGGEHISAAAASSWRGGEHISAAAASSWRGGEHISWYRPQQRMTRWWTHFGCSSASRGGEHISAAAALHEVVHRSSRDLQDFKTVSHILDSMCKYQSTFETHLVLVDRLTKVLHSSWTIITKYITSFQHRTCPIFQMSYMSTCPIL